MITNIPIFDSLTHPTLDGDWIMPKYPKCAGVDMLLSQMQNYNYCGAFAVGMRGIGNYDEDTFIQMIKSSQGSNLFPIAFYVFVQKNKEII